MKYYILHPILGSLMSIVFLQSGVEGRTAHVYSVAGVAHHRLQHDIGLLNQAILVSGESGSGKVSFG